MSYYALEPILSLLPAALHTPLLAVIAAHAFVVVIWILLFLKDVLRPPKLDKQD